MALLTDVVDRIGTKVSVLSSILLLLLLLTVAQTVFSWYRMRHIPGPFSAKFSKFWLVRTARGGGMDWEYSDASEKYGSLVRIGPSHLITTNPEQMKRMLSTRTTYQRSSWYVSTRFDPSRDNIESERDAKKHAHLRQMMAPGYSGKENENLEQSVDRIVTNLIALLNNKYISTDSDYRPVDLARKIHYFALDNISLLAHGKPFGFLTADVDVHDYISTTETVIPASTMVSIFPWLNWVLQLPIINRIVPSDQDPTGFGKIKGITKQVVSERFGPGKKEQRDMLGSFIRHGLDQNQLESETIVQLLAGSDTTATALRTTMLHIISNPRVLSKLRAEIRQAPISPLIKDSEAKKLPYLQAVIREGLRICPPIAALLAKEVPPEGDTVDGFFVPGGTQIGWSSRAMFRNKETFGQDADTFRPERWLEGSPEKIKKAEQVWELIFSYGKHHCLGKNIALMELNKMFVELLRRFDFTIVDPANPMKSRCYGIFLQSEMWVVITKIEEH